jgi:hypothetical protein
MTSNQIPVGSSSLGNLGVGPNKYHSPSLSLCRPTNSDPEYSKSEMGKDNQQPTLVVVGTMVKKTRS